MRAALAGDANAYRNLLSDVAAALRGSVRAALRRAGRGDGDAEDIVQDVLLALHLKRGNWDSTLPLRPWLNAIARHKIIDALRRRHIHGAVDIDEVSDVLAAEPAAEPIRADLEKMLCRLNPRQQAIVRAATLEERTIADIAMEMSMSEGAVRVALHRALKDLARLYREGSE